MEFYVQCKKCYKMVSINNTNCWLCKSPIDRTSTLYKLCKTCSFPNTLEQTECRNCRRTLPVPAPHEIPVIKPYATPQREKRTIINNPFRSSVGRFAAHSAVIGRIATDVAAACAKSYEVTKVHGENFKSTFKLFFHDNEIYFDTFNRFRFRDYGMGIMNKADIPEFRTYFRSVFADKFRAELNKQVDGTCYEFNLKDYSYGTGSSASHHIDVTVWFRYSSSGLTAW